MNQKSIMVKKIILIIPAYNEEDNILNTVNLVLSFNETHNLNYDIIVINDGSKDKTEDILINNNIKHINLIHNLGIGGAVQTGYKYAYDNDYDIAVQYDGDGQHDVRYVANIINPIVNEGVDMTIGSRFVKESRSVFKSSMLRRIGINLISGVIKLKMGKRIYDTTSGFRAANRKVMKLFVDNYPVEYPEPISTVNVLTKGYDIKEIPVEMKAREAGKSSISSWKSVYYMINVVLSILLVRKVK